MRWDRLQAQHLSNEIAEANDELGSLHVPTGGELGGGLGRQLYLLLGCREE